MGDAVFHDPTKTNIEIDLSPEQLGLPKAAGYAVFDYWANRFEAPLVDRLKATLSARGCRVLAVRPMTDHPQLVSTSRHVTQGMVDVLEEKWDAAKRELSGRSRVVGGDDYELRIVAAGANRAWKATGVELTIDDKTTEATAKVQQDGANVRISIEPKTSCEVRWTIRFE